MHQQAVLDTFIRLIAEGSTGFTIGMNGLEYRPEKGFAVGMKRCESIEEAISLLEPNIFLGWWRDCDGAESIDLVCIFPEKWMALIVAYQRGQTTIYDFGEDAVIDV